MPQVRNTKCITDQRVIDWKKKLTILELGSIQSLKLPDNNRLQLQSRLVAVLSSFVP